MRKFGLISSLALASLFATMSACAVDPAEDPPGTETQTALAAWKAEDPSATSRSVTADDASSARSTDEVVSPATSCSVVQFCNAPGSDGTRCLQQGCSLTTALNECTVESRRVCGTPVCPWVFVALDGTRFLNTSCL